MSTVNDMTDSTRLPVVAWWLKNSGGEKDLVGLGSGEHVYQGVYDEKIFLCRLTDAQLQAAPAGRGAPDETAMARALCNYHADLCGVNRDDQWNLYSEDFLNDVAVMLAADRRLNPAPATADSDVREVKE